MEINWTAKCDLFILACVRYYHSTDTESPISDYQYDRLIKELHDNWFKLPSWFTSRMAQEDFLGSGFVWGFKYGTKEWSHDRT